MTTIGDASADTPGWPDEPNTQEIRPMSKAEEIDDLASEGEVGTKPERPCHLCGGRDYTWGHMFAQGINFIPEDSHWLTKAFRAGMKLRARRCESCGNVQMFA
jgi:hypothetical protein